MNWQPISTAPRDDTTVLLWEPTLHDPRGRVSLGSFREDGMMPELGAMWLQNDYDDFSCGMESTPVSATFWMPIPEPPASAMSAGTAETQSGSGLQPASAVGEAETPKASKDIGGPSQ